MLRSHQNAHETGRRPLDLSPVVKEKGCLTAEDIRALVGRDDPVILEIGANVGDTTQQILSVMPQAKIFAFEPDPRAIAEFHASIQSTNVKLFECAVGSRNGTAVFHQSTGEGEFKNWNKSGSLRQPKTHLETWPGVKFESIISVPIIRLDDWAKEMDISAIDFIWTDVQGAELDLVQGGLDTINQARFFYTEYSDKEWYEGQPTLKTLHSSLEHFNILRLFESDVLFENIRLNGMSPVQRVDSLFHHYGITGELLTSNLLFEPSSANSNNSNLSDIRQIVEKISPQSSGHPLLRIGAAGDGGYLVPDDLQGIEACFSPGVNNFKDFEDCLSVQYGIKAYMCDYTSDVGSLRTPLIRDMQFFEKKWLDVRSDDHNVDINTWVESNSTPGSDLLLQMDIEGAEYRNLLHAHPETLSRFRIIIVEFHDLNNLLDIRFLNGIFAPTINKLIAQFTCVHAHANNCCGYTGLSQDLKIPNVLELTFIRNDRLKTPTIPLVLPNELDAHNVNSHAPLLLEGIWLRHADPVASEVAGLRQNVHWLLTKLKNYSELNSHLEEVNAKVTHLLAESLLTHENIALGKRATQSSVSPWSTPAGAGGAINGNKTGAFGFHTAYENNPWWMVDLGVVYDLYAIRLFNRLDAGSERVKTLKISVSLDSKDWTLVHDQQNSSAFGGLRPLNGRPPLLILLDNTRARFVRISLAEKNYLHLDEVEIYRVR